jgi:hypothetical protein
MTEDLDSEEWSRKPLPIISGPALLPCPFCGAEGVHAKESFGGDGFVVKCSRGAYFGDPDGCGVAPSTQPFISSEYAAKNWNERIKKKQKAV